ncbi:MAG: class I SAM-dependent methyltransferase, partial [Thiotrichaceae bacterium]
HPTINSSNHNSSNVVIFEGIYMATHQIDSLIKFTNSQGIGATGTLVQISRNSIVMEVYNPYSIVQLSEVLDDLHIRREDRIIYQGRAVVSTLVNTGLYLIVSATLVEPWKDLSGLEQDPLGIQEEAERFLSDWESSHQLDQSFQLVINDIRSLLLELSRWLEQVDLFAENDGVTHSRELTHDLFSQLQHPLLPKLTKLFGKFEEEAAKIAEDKVGIHRNFAQRDLHPLLLRSPFLWRTYNKPLGYAGDYEMVNMMLRDPYEGPTMYSKLINSLMLKLGPVAGHQNRIDILVDILKKKSEEASLNNKKLRVLNIACGPALEVQQLIQAGQLDDSVEFTLLDFSEETLSHTKHKIDAAINTGSLKPTIKYIHKSVHTLLKEAGKEMPDNNYYDMVYCAGLFDYISDKVCNRLLRLFYQQTKVGGLTLVTNVHSENPALYQMEYLMEWHLIYRDEAHFLKLFPDKGEQTVYRDKSGTNLFLEIQKTD